MVPPTGSFRSHKLFNSGRSPVMEANQFRVKVTVTVAIISHGFLLRTKFHGTDSAAINNKPLPFYFFFFSPFSFYRNHVNASTYARRKIESRLSSTPTFTRCAFALLHVCFKLAFYNCPYFFYFSLSPVRVLYWT